MYRWNSAKATHCLYLYPLYAVHPCAWMGCQPSSTNACNINYYCRTREPSRFLLLHPIRIQGEMMKHSSGGGGGGDVAAAHSVLGILITPASTRKWRHCYRDSSGDRNKYTEDAKTTKNTVKKLSSLSFLMLLPFALLLHWSCAI